MAVQKLVYAKNKDIAASMQAILRAAGLARKEAVQTVATTVIIQDRQIVRITPKQLRAKLGDPIDVGSKSPLL